MRPYLKKIYHKKELAEWLKVKALSSSPSTEKKKIEVLSVYQFGNTKMLNSHFCFLGIYIHLRSLQTYT
jgi:hypothetical protein